MPTLAYVLLGSEARAQQELSYSVLSALKHGLDGVELMLICDATNRRPDLPVKHLVVESETLARWSTKGQTPHLAQVHALRAGLHRGLGHERDHEAEPLCLVQTNTVFRASPAMIFERITPQQALVQDRAGWLSSHDDWTRALANCTAPAWQSTSPQTELFDFGVIGVTPQHAALLDKSLAMAQAIPPDPPHGDMAQLALSVELQAAGQIAFASDIMTHYADYMRHVYHGRFDVMFPHTPDGPSPVNTALAEHLPEIKEPPMPLLHRLRAKAYALRHGLGRASAFGYLAALCARTAPTPEGRNVWANIALDLVEQGQRSPSQLRRDLPFFAPDALAQAGLDAPTTARWAAFWAAVDRQSQRNARPR